MPLSKHVAREGIIPMVRYLAEEMSMRRNDRATSQSQATKKSRCDDHKISTSIPKFGIAEKTSRPFRILREFVSRT